MTSELFMRRCLELARQGIGHVSPNPMVGAVLVHEGNIVAEGFHHIFGGPHAEVEAINALADKTLLPRCTLYVSLEPCCGTGKKTPPCTDLVIASKIPSVVIAAKDPNPAVSGKGIAALYAAGVSVESGVLESEARALNRGFFSWHERKRPWIILKWAQTADGFMARADGSSKWISSEESRTLTHRWRAEEDAILVGRKTVEIDNPELTVRHVEGRNPLRVVYDPRGVLKKDFKIFDSSARTLILSDIATNGKSAAAAITEALYTHKILSVIVEGGAQLLNSFIAEGLWDEARVFEAPHSFGAGLKAPALPCAPIGQEKSGNDALYRYVRN